MHTPVALHASQKLDVPALQQLVWQSPVVHCAPDEHVAPAASSEQSPEITEYGALHAVHAPVASHVLHWIDLPAAQQRVWQSSFAHSRFAEHVVPAGARHLPELSV